MEAIKSINKAKKEIILGDFKEIAHNIKEKKPSTILQDEVELLNQVLEKAVIPKETEEQFFAGLKEYGL